jgi:hypothetical protein
MPYVQNKGENDQPRVFPKFSYYSLPKSFVFSPDSPSRFRLVGLFDEPLPILDVSERNNIIDGTILKQQAR